MGNDGWENQWWMPMLTAGPSVMIKAADWWAPCAQYLPDSASAHVPSGRCRQEPSVWQEVWQLEAWWGMVTSLQPPVSAWRVQANTHTRASHPPGPWFPLVTRTAVPFLSIHTHTAEGRALRLSQSGMPEMKTSSLSIINSQNIRYFFITSYMSHTIRETT